MRKIQKPFQHSGYQEFKRQGSCSSTASGIAETVKCEKTKSHFRHLATGSSRDKGAALPLHQESPKPKMQKVPKSHFGISAIGSSRDKGVSLPLHRESPKPEMRKAPRSHFGISATGDFKGQRVSLFHCISKPRNAKCEKRPGAISTFRLLGLQRTKGCFLCFQSRPPSMEEAVNEY
jgi:hypothetical protein